MKYLIKFQHNFIVHNPVPLYIETITSKVFVADDHKDLLKIFDIFEEIPKEIRDQASMECVKITQTKKMIWFIPEEK